MPQTKERKAEYQRDFRNKKKGLQLEGTSGTGTSDKVLYLDNGSYIHINKLIDPKWRKLLTYLCEHMRYPDGLRVGVQGPTITEIKPLLEATA